MISLLVLAGCTSGTGPGFDRWPPSCGLEELPGSLAWVDAVAGEPNPRELELAHDCDEVVVVDVELMGSAFDVPDDSFTIEPGARGRVVVHFEARDAEEHEGRLLVRPHRLAAGVVALRGGCDLDQDGDGWETNAAWGGDCDDTDPAVNPDAEEVCNGIDDDCDGAVDGGLTLWWYADHDRDGWGVEGDLVPGGCEAPAYGAEVAGDCDDTDPTIYPGAPEPDCDGVDHDCDGDRGSAALLGSVGHATVAAAVAAAAPGDTVWVCQGMHAVYLNLYRRDLTLAAYSGDASDTVLDGEEAHTIIDVSGGSLVLRDLTLTRGSRRYWGGAVVVYGGAHFTSERCVFERNLSPHADGAAVDLTLGEGDAAVLKDCRFTGNEAEYGGALNIDVRGAATVEVTGCSFEANRAQWGGGALTWTADDAGWLAVDDSTFTDNEAGADGGAIEIAGTDASEVELEGTSFEANCSGGDGGAIAVDPSGTEGPTLALADVTFSANHADGAGGALALLDGRTRVTAEGVDFDGSTAGTSGAAIYVGEDAEDAMIRLDSCAVVSNAVAGGGAVETTEVVLLTSDDTDWGTGATDNDAYDLVVPGATYDALGTSESFTCVGSSCAWQ